MNAQQQREHYKAVKARLRGLPAPTKAKPRPLAVVVYSEPAGPSNVLRNPLDFRSPFILTKPTASNNVKGICQEVCNKHGLQWIAIISHRKQANYVAARHELYWRLSNETTWSLPRIGKLIGGRDHTTILSGCRRQEQRMREAGQ